MKNIKAGDLVFVFPDNRDILFLEQSILGTVLLNKATTDGKPPLSVLVEGQVFNCRIDQVVSAKEK